MSGLTKYQTVMENTNIIVSLNRYRKHLIVCADSGAIFCYVLYLAEEA